MLEVARILGGSAAVLLVAAIAAWLLFPGPELRRLDRSTARDVGNVEIASQLLVLALSVSAMAAVLAVVGWFAA